MINVIPKIARDGFYSTADAAELLAVDPRTIYRWKKAGYLKAKKNWRNGRDYFMGYDLIRVMGFTPSARKMSR